MSERQDSCDPSSEAVSQIAAKPTKHGQRQRPLLFEIAWEVCAQAGGIYTVLRSKAPAAVRQWGNDYWLIGPYREGPAAVEFEEEEPTGPVRVAIEKLRERGIVIRAGRWLVTGRPQVLLVDLKSVEGKLGEYKYFLWKDVGIETPSGAWNLDETVSFGFVVAELMETVREQQKARPMLAHFHEWQAAVALPILRHRQIGLPMVFTTHATQVGRILSAASVDLYDHLPNINGEAEAHNYDIAPQFYIERAAARAADVFTTVSGITAMEAEQFFSRKADVLLPNGLNVERFSAPYQFQNLHRQNKKLIDEFVMGHFFPSYTFDLNRTLYIFTAGRYEYRNKGFDVFIESLYRLNQRLKANPEGVTVVAFIIAPAQYRSLSVGVLNRQAMFNELRETCESIEREMGATLFNTVAGQGRLPTTDDLLDEFARVRLKRMMHAWKQGPPPMIVTHDLVDDANDPILCHLRHRGLINLPDDPVKVVFHPEFITSTSPVLGLEYEQFVRGCNMGVFPSYYEPWGYTPMECVVRGIPTITSDYSGFGAYAMSHFPDHNDNGIFVARRRGESPDTTVEDVTRYLHLLVRMSRRERITMRNRVEAHAEHFDWNRMTRYYAAARRFAFRAHHPEADISIREEAHEPSEVKPRATPPKEPRRAKLTGGTPPSVNRSPET